MGEQGQGRQPLRFGIVRNQTLPWPVLVEQFRRFEALGFDSAWPCDHFQRPSEQEAPYFEGWTLLAALAAVTDRIRLGLLVSSNTFRHPALLAKMAVTVDHVSGGRLELGLGTGWYEAEHRRFGLPFPETPELVGRFEEAVEILDLMLRQELTTFDGRYYRLADAPSRPSPIQQPRPPLTLGAHGPRMLRITARYADRWSSYGTVDQIRDRNARLDHACAAIGRDPRSIIRSFFAMAPRPMPGPVGARLEVDPWGSPAAFEEIVGWYREAGMDEFLVDGPQDHQWDVVERVAGEVIPRLRIEAAD
jgi:F420-dependent oxidoreductase-like protein